MYELYNTNNAIQYIVTSSILISCLLNMSKWSQSVHHVVGKSRRC